MSKPIQDSLQLVKQAQVEVNKNLASPEYNSNLLELNSLFQRIISRLLFMGGILEPETAGEKKKLQPFTSFMGKTIKEDKTAAADLDPTEDLKRRYLQKVDKLYSEIGTMQPSIVLNSYTIPEDIIVLRGVAKKAGVEGFETKELNIEFIEEIVFAIEKKKEDDRILKKANDNKNEGVEVTVTQELLDKSKFLRDKKIMIGQKVLQLPDNKFKLIEAATA